MEGAVVVGQQPVQAGAGLQVLVGQRAPRVLALERAVPVVLHAVVGAPRQQLCDDRPLVAVHLLGFCAVSSARMHALSLRRQQNNAVPCAR